MQIGENDLLVIFSTIVLLLVISMMFVVYSYFLRQKSKLLLAQKERDLEFRNELAMSHVEIKEQTLSYVGQELHDDLGQKLSVARLMTNKLTSKLTDENQDLAKETSVLIAECIQDIRDLSKTLISEQVEHFGLIDSLEVEMNRLKKLSYLNTDFHFNNHDIDISSKHALILFRVIQECINNALKHSKSRQIVVTVEDEDQVLRVNISDNGKGFVTTEIQDGSGLKNMKNRAKVIGAELIVNSELEKGTDVKINYYKNTN